EHDKAVTSDSWLRRPRDRSRGRSRACRRGCKARERPRDRSRGRRSQLSEVTALSCS
ncbi:hypothetical protein T484DRAFT_1918860, partial [Baffinella frigidus]